MLWCISWYAFCKCPYAAVVVEGGEFGFRFRLEAVNLRRKFLNEVHEMNELTLSLKASGSHR